MTRVAATLPDPDRLDEYIACPACDALLHDREVHAGEIGACPRCHHVIELPREGAMTRITMLAIAAQLLLTAAILFPFLEVGAAGMSRDATLIDAIRAYARGLNEPLVLALAALIVVVPTLRFLAMIYVLAPMSFGYSPRRHAAPVLRMAEAARPWAMAEIFIVGVAVALVKVAGLADVRIGPAFWALVVLVIVTIAKDLLLSKVTLWKTLDARRLS